MIEHDYNKVLLFEIPKLDDNRGSLSFIEVGTHIPSSISSMCCLSNLSKENKFSRENINSQSEILVALSGNIQVKVENIKKKESVYMLDQPNKALYLPKHTKRSLNSSSANTICLIININSESKAAQSNKLSINNKKGYEHTVSDCTLFKLSDYEQNSLSVNSLTDIPFQINRVFFTYNIPQKAERGIHAQTYCHEILIAIKGSFKVELDDGRNTKTVMLDDPQYGLLIPPGIWAKEKEYSNNSICLVLASEGYNREGYINSYEHFKNYKNDKS